MVAIIPTILEQDFKKFRQKLDIISPCVDRISIDVIEQSFRDNQTLFPQDWGQIPDNLQIDVHLMVNQPILWVKQSIKAGAKTIIGQLETIGDQAEFVKVVKNFGVKSGLALQIETPIEKIDPQLFSRLNCVLLMGIEIGFAGQQFQPQVLAKIKQAKQLLPPGIEVGVDGGISLETGRQCLEAGADILCVNSFLWSDLANNLAKLQNLS